MGEGGEKEGRERGERGGREKQQVTSPSRSKVRSISAVPACPRPAVQGFRIKLEREGGCELGDCLKRLRGMRRLPPDGVGIGQAGKGRGRGREREGKEMRAPNPKMLKHKQSLQEKGWLRSISAVGQHPASPRRLGISWT